MKTSIKQNYGQVKRGFYKENENTLVSTERNFLNKRVYEIEYLEDPIEDDNYSVNGYTRNENIPNEKRVIDEDDPITNDDEEDESDDFNNLDDLEEDNEKEDDEIDKTSEEFYPENNPRQF
ncbi:hypothetical protein [Flavobacterium sp. N3904]|uniref:hypothetical protein n=1 Tax=Flavobacterium sp. N3904 TaxID=2986835 RepID=UPI002224C191|nr:hypothetical protein [Flavobacterium sp. N3904]